MHDDDYEVVEVNKGGSRFSAFVWGALIGAGVALLTARRTGEETREMLNQRKDELVDQAMQYREKAADLAQTAREKAVEKVDQVKTRAVELQEQAVDTARGYVANIADRTQNVAEDVKRAAAGDEGPVKDEEGMILTNSEKDYPL